MKRAALCPRQFSVVKESGKWYVDMSEPDSRRPLLGPFDHQVLADDAISPLDLAVRAFVNGYDIATITEVLTFNKTHPCIVTAISEFLANNASIYGRSFDFGSLVKDLKVARHEEHGA